jgi:anti-anti-sigma factor
VLTLSGELDAASAHELEERITSVLAEPHARLVLDLKELSFVDSAGINVLIRAKQMADEGGRRLVLRRPTAQLDRVFALVGVVDWLDVED